jgi:hypothetical protein
MTDRSILERNKAVLWARDIISRPEQCLIATAGDTLPDCVTVTTLDGVEVASCSLLSSGAVLLEEFTRAVNGKELVAVGLPSNLIQLIRGRGIVVHDLLYFHGLYINAVEPPIKVDVPANELVNWVRDSLTRMSGSSLVLDQADTGAGKWTSSHFKPSPTMIDKLKSFIKS